MNIRRKLAGGAAGLLALGVGSLGLGLAQAQTTPPPPAPATAGTQAAPAPAQADLGGVEAPDTGGDAAEGPEATAPEPAGEAQLPGGGHADPVGQNVDHQFGGAE